MADPHVLTRVLDELLWMLRREGLPISTAQAIEAARAAMLVGLVDRETFKNAIAATVVTRSSERARFDRAFDAYFAAEPRADLWERLAQQGFGRDELRVLRDAFAAWTDAIGADASDLAFFQRGSELEQLLSLSGVARAAAALGSELQLGFATHRALQAAGLPRARTRLSALRTQLRDALGDRGDVLADALARELDASEGDVREHFTRLLAKREEDRKPTRTTRETTPLMALAPGDIEEVRRAVRRFAERLRGGARVRRRHARRGKIDPHRTLRRAMRTGGVPMRLYRRDKTRDKPRIVLLCDVSESVRATSNFMLELVYAAHDLFDRTRSFVFVSDVAETTQIFERLPPAAALAEAYAGAVPVSANSNYGRALRAFESREADRLDHRTTLVVLGDGRTNFQDDGADVVRRLRAKVKHLYWLCPEPTSGWGVGDSAMLRYAPQCTRVLEVRTARDLEDAARLLVHGA